MARSDHLRLLQFRAGYNLPVHAAVKHGIFATHDLEVEVAYTPGSDYLIESLQTGKCEIAHPAADDLWRRLKANLISTIAKSIYFSLWDSIAVS